MMTQNVRFILASASPRRHDLLCSVGVPHEILVTDADECPAGRGEVGGLYAAWFAREVSRIKGEAATLELLRRGICPADSENAEREQVFVISADTVVSPDGEVIFGKPEDADDAARMLWTLSGGVHYVLGGITVTQLSCGKVTRSVSRSVVTRVRFKHLTDAAILSYIDSGEPFGKAGAYAIQGLGSVFVDSVEGDYPNVVGISTSELFSILEEEFSLRLAEKSRRVIKNA